MNRVPRKRGRPRKVQFNNEDLQPTVNDDNNNSSEPSESSDSENKMEEEQAGNVANNKQYSTMEVEK